MRPEHLQLVYPPLRKRAGRPFRGYPAVTVAYYGPDDALATKAVAALVPSKGAEPTEVRSWQTGPGDARRDPLAGDEILVFARRHGAASLIVSERIIGCPHQEGVDYPEGEACPACPFWRGRDRWTGATAEP